MKIHVFFILPIVLIFSCQAVAKKALRDVVLIEGGDYVKLNFPEKLNWQRSLGARRLIRDRELPRPSYPKSLARRIRLARLLFAAAVIATPLSLVAMVSAIFLGLVE